MPIKIFFCYAHEYKAMRDELEKHLGALLPRGKDYSGCYPYLFQFHTFELIQPIEFTDSMLKGNVKQPSKGSTLSTLLTCRLAQ
jgi:hypothetical protein